MASPTPNYAALFEEPMLFDESLTIVEQTILDTLKIHNIPLTNQDVRRLLHQDGRSVTKKDINQSLYSLKNKGIINFRQIGKDKAWSIRSNL
jgi:uncharacterized protein YneF (UPF0154 family)